LIEGIVEDLRSLYAGHDPTNGHWRSALKSRALILTRQLCMCSLAYLALCEARCR
jgi:hypothetical protein